MPFQKGKARTGGRQKGVPNKATASVKEAFQYAFDKMGGPENLASWGRKHPADFYKLYARLISQEANQPDKIPSQPQINPAMQKHMQKALANNLKRLALKFNPELVDTSVVEKNKDQTKST